MPATLDLNVIVNILRTAGAVARAEFGLICYGSNDTTFAVGIHKLYETPAAVSADTELSADAKAAGLAFFAQSNHPPRLMICEVDDELVAPGGELGASLDAAWSAQRFYCLVLQSKVLLQIQTADTWTATVDGQHWAQSSDAPFLAGTGDATNIGWVVDQAATGRTMVIYHEDDTEELALALAAEFFFVDPDYDITTAAYQSATGMTTDDITDTEKANVLGVNGNVYLTMGGQPALFPGTMGGGDFADNVLSADWGKARMTEAIQQLLLDVASLKRKIPYTDEGIGMIEGEVKGVQQRGEEIGHYVAGRSTTTVQKSVDITSAIKRTRAFTMAATSYFTGAIQAPVTVNFTILE